MKIVVAGGQTKADFLIGLLLEKKHKIKIINDNADYGTYLAKKYGVPVFINDPSDHESLEEADIYDYDLLIALTPSDADNLVICKTARKLFNVKKVVAIVSNPRSVDVFKALGINTAISATYMVAKMIEQASTFESIVNTLMIESDKIAITDVIVNSTSPLINRALKDIKFSRGITIGCILRDLNVVIPKGDTTIMENDKLLIISEANKQDEVLEAVFGKKA